MTGKWTVRKCQCGDYYGINCSLWVARAPGESSNYGLHTHFGSWRRMLDYAQREASKVGPYRVWQDRNPWPGEQINAMLAAMEDR